MMDEETIVEVKTADCAISNAPTKLVTHGIGSCVVICLYYSSLSLGGLVHCMLPKATLDYKEGYRYVDLSLNILLNMLEKKGAKKNALIVSLIGGAQMFKVLESSTMNIGQRNIDEAKRWFSENGLAISMLDVGGNSGRNVEFDLSTGIVKVIKNL